MSGLSEGLFLRGLSGCVIGVLCRASKAQASSVFHRIIF